MPDVRPLYNIPNILASDTVIWVEGEKCADALNNLGYTATCTMGGIRYAYKEVSVTI